MTRCRTKYLLSSAILPAAVLSAASPALAQATEETETTAQSGDGSEIIVTGSRIRRDNYTSPEPLTIIDRGSMTQQGFNSQTDALQSNAVTAGSSQ